jgi:hypothetical protein
LTWANVRSFRGEKFSQHKNVLKLKTWKTWKEGQFVREECEFSFKHHLPQMSEDLNETTPNG